MRVDGARFRELVIAIAAAPCCSCATTPAPPPEAQVAFVPLEIKPIAETKASAPVATSKPPESPPPAPSARGIWTLPYDPTAPPKSCSQLKCGGPVNEAMGALRSSCKGFAEDLRPEAFQHVMTCLMRQNNTRNTCDLMLIGTSPGECLEGWASPPTLDPATASKCKPIVAACANAGATFTMEACQGLFSVTTSRAERRMVHCAMEYCSSDLCYIRI